MRLHGLQLDSGQLSDIYQALWPLNALRRQVRERRRRAYVRRTIGLLLLVALAAESEHGDERAPG